MTAVFSALLCLLAGAPGLVPAPGPVSPAPAGGEAPACAAPCGGPKGCGWTAGCFPRCGCPDDYCPNPYPRSCWPPYPPFYRCVPAGNCGPADGCGRGTGRLTWWFVPTPRALREALGWQP
jgi:hypothetical protein